MSLVIVLDATLPGPLPDEQHEYLERTLKEVGDRYRWRVVLAHLPLWPIAIGREAEILRDARLETTLQRFDVTLFVSGHHHAFWAGTSRDGTVYVSNGSLGGSVRRLVGESRSRPFSFSVIDLPRTGPVQVTALLAPDFRSSVPLDSLPAQMARAGGALTRLVQEDAVPHVADVVP